MTTPMSTVTEYEEKVLELLVKAQDEILGYVKQAVAVLDDRLPEYELPEIALLDEVPTLEELVTTQFAFSKKVLTTQERFAKNVVKAVKPLTRDAKPKAKATKATTKAA
jgi:hypothetical protein